MYTGGGICNYIDEIGGAIDFLILDTVHLCPGEILDFLVCLPYLTENAVVVMHDIAMQYASKRSAYATQLLLDTVSAEKIVGRDMETGYAGYPNIGAFKLNKDTQRYIDNVFSALNISWEYMPEELDLYRSHLAGHYKAELIELLGIAAENNKRKLIEREDEKYNSIRAWTDFVLRIQNRDVYIYGNGKVAKRLHKALNSTKIRVKGHIVSDGESKGEGVYYLDEIDKSSNGMIVVGVGEKLKPVIKDILDKAGRADYIIPDSKTYACLNG